MISIKELECLLGYTHIVMVESNEFLFKFPWKLPFPLFEVNICIS